MSKGVKIRTFNVNDPNERKSNRFATNQVHTTKYSPWTFLFRFLLYELSRPANIFFCIIIFIQVTFFFIQNNFIKQPLPCFVVVY
jgi:hypothetical protein